MYELLPPVLPDIVEKWFLLVYSPSKLCERVTCQGGGFVFAAENGKRNFYHRIFLSLQKAPSDFFSSLSVNSAPHISWVLTRKAAVRL